MADNKIMLMPVSELDRMKFFIPGYQRGYRWTRQQVLDLLDDINQFQPEETDHDYEQTWYCLQPLVVKSRVSDIMSDIRSAETVEEVQALLKGNWEVIDGQQRLTTIHILLSYLGWGDMTPYSIEYETRNGSQEFITELASEDVRAEKEDENIDFYHMSNTWKVVSEWFGSVDCPERREVAFMDSFRNKVLNNVKFIWYESVDRDSIEVFKNLNSGKIALTNAELIKALFLNRSNFKTGLHPELILRQKEMASEWDTIEYSLHNEEFWLFLNNVAGRFPDTRIETIFNVAYRLNVLGLEEGALKNVRRDELMTFDYFYKYFQQCSFDMDIRSEWEKIKRIHQTFEEWFNDSTLYHYTGFLIAAREEDSLPLLVDLIKTWNSNPSKDAFREALKDKIRDRIRGCNNLETVYEIPQNGERAKAKTACRPLLLLHNIETVLRQNERADSSYGMGVFYKFPFNLFKVEKWDVEHIDSNTENDMERDEDRIEYLLNIYNAVNEDSQQRIEKFVKNPDKGAWDELGKLVEAPKESLDEKEKNQVWNFTLLDSSTNKSYGNSIFSAKRRIIIGKDKGVRIPVPEVSKVKGKSEFVPGEETKASSSFIPPCTKYVFMKYYSVFSASPNYWDKEDARAYRKDILSTLREFGVYDPETGNDDKA